MRITRRIFLLAIPLLLVACTKWGPDKKASRAVDLYLGVQDVSPQGIIPRGTICRVDQRISAGKVYGFHKIECQNGQSGYLMLGDDEEAFGAKHRAEWPDGPDQKASRSVNLYADFQRTAMTETIPSGTICRIDPYLSIRKIYAFHKIECQNGQSGYLMMQDEQAFEPTY